MWCDSIIRSIKINWRCGCQLNRQTKVESICNRFFNLQTLCITPDTLGKSMWHRHAVDDNVNLLKNRQRWHILFECSKHIIWLNISISDGLSICIFLSPTKYYVKKTQCQGPPRPTRRPSGREEHIYSFRASDSNRRNWMRAIDRNCKSEGVNLFSHRRGFANNAIEHEKNECKTATLNHEPIERYTCITLFNHTLTV
jgi:hypothetical protein